MNEKGSLLSAHPRKISLRERASQNRTIYVIPLFANHGKSGFDWAAGAGLILRWCPFCLLDSIIGHGWRRKQAHDESHDWIRYRRGLCPLCGVIFSFLPAFSLPYTHYSLVARSTALQRRFVEHRSWEDAAPPLKNPHHGSRSLHPAPLVSQPGFFSARLLLSIPHAASCGAVDGPRRAARLRLVAPVVAHRLSLPASLLALAAAFLKSNFFLAPHHLRLGSAA